VWECDACGGEYRSGQCIRYRCEECEDFDLCGCCLVTNNDHPHTKFLFFDIQNLEKSRGFFLFSFSHQTSISPSLCLISLHSILILPPDLLPNVGIFMCKEWWRCLCSCPQCATLYVSKRLGFLLQEREKPSRPTSIPPHTPQETSTNKDEPQSHNNSVSLDQTAFNAFMNSGIDHSQKLRYLEGFNVLQQKLKSFLSNLQSKGVNLITEQVFIVFVEYNCLNSNLLFPFQLKAYS
jgi:hypothetical protein